MNQLMTDRVVSDLIPIPPLSPPLAELGEEAGRQLYNELIFAYRRADKRLSPEHIRGLLECLHFGQYLVVRNRAGEVVGAAAYWLFFHNETGGIIYGGRPANIARGDSVWIPGYLAKGAKIKRQLLQQIRNIGGGVPVAYREEEEIRFLPTISKDKGGANNGRRRQRSF